jgi:hypothetical protein
MKPVDVFFFEPEAVEGDFQEDSTHPLEIVPKCERLLGCHQIVDTVFFKESVCVIIHFGERAIIAVRAYIFDLGFPFQKRVCMWVVAKFRIWVTLVEEIRNNVLSREFGLL